MPKDESMPLNPDTLMLAYLCIKDVEVLTERVAILDRFGLNDNQIATVCGAVLQSVRNARSQYKKGKQKKTTLKSKSGGQ